LFLQNFLISMHDGPTTNWVMKC